MDEGADQALLRPQAARSIKTPRCSALSSVVALLQRAKNQLSGQLGDRNPARSRLRVQAIPDRARHTDGDASLILEALGDRSVKGLPSALARVVRRTREWQAQKSPSAKKRRGKGKR